MLYYCLVSSVGNPGVGGDIDPGSVVKVDTDDWLYFVKNIELPAHLFGTQNILSKTTCTWYTNYMSVC